MKIEIHIHHHADGNCEVLAGIHRLERGQERLMDDMTTVRGIVQEIFTKTNQMAADEQAESALLNDVKARLDALIAGGGVPQDILDSLTAASTALDGVTATNAASIARLQSWGQDPTNPLP